MQPTDLRTGNWVKYDGRIVEVVGIDPPGPLAGSETEYRSIWLKVMDTGCTFRIALNYEVEGIPLTPEILVKCGFELKYN